MGNVMGEASVTLLHVLVKRVLLMQADHGKHAMGIRKCDIL